MKPERDTVPLGTCYLPLTRAHTEGSSHEAPPKQHPSPLLGFSKREEFSHLCISLMCTRLSDIHCQEKEGEKLSLRLCFC